MEVNISSDLPQRAATEPTSDRSCLQMKQAKLLIINIFEIKSTCKVYPICCKVSVARNTGMYSLSLVQDCSLLRIFLQANEVLKWCGHLKLKINVRARIQGILVCFEPNSTAIRLLQWVALPANDNGPQLFNKQCLTLHRSLILALNSNGGSSSTSMVWM